MRDPILTEMLKLFYAGDTTVPIIDRLIDTLPDEHEHIKLARSGTWTGTLEGWAEHGPYLVQKAPILCVNVSDKHPMSTISSQDKVCRWWACRHLEMTLVSAREWRACPYHIPLCLFCENYKSVETRSRFYTYQSVSQAKEFLSSKLLGWALSQSKHKTLIEEY